MEIYFIVTFVGELTVLRGEQISKPGGGGHFLIWHIRVCAIRPSMFKFIFDSACNRQVWEIFKYRCLFAVLANILPMAYVFHETSEMYSLLTQLNLVPGLLG